MALFSFATRSDPIHSNEAKKKNKGYHNYSPAFPISLQCVQFAGLALVSFLFRGGAPASALKWLSRKNERLSWQPLCNVDKCGSRASIHHAGGFGANAPQFPTSLTPPPPNLSFLPSFCPSSVLPPQLNPLLHIHRKPSHTLLYSSTVQVIPPTSPGGFVHHVLRIFKNERERSRAESSMSLHHPPLLNKRASNLYTGGRRRWWRRRRRRHQWVR